jgi:IclR family transcriptional regulator, acetate operon repressor
VQKHGEEGAGRQPAYPITSVDNALRLLMQFRSQPRVRLSEAAEHLGVALSTAHRLMAMLAYHGFVRQDQDTRAYVAGPALVEIGLAAVRQLDIRMHARPVLEGLAADLGETVHLAVLEGGNIRYIDAVESSHALRVAARTGSVLAATCTASGKALLAALPDGEVAALFPDDSSLVALTVKSITTRSGLLKELDAVRKRGFALNREESEEDVASVAVPVPGPRGVPVAAMVVSGPVSRMTDGTARTIGGRLRDEAARLSNLLLRAT